MSNKIIVKDHKYYFKIRGLGGVKGDKGDTGPAGPQGPQGPYVDVVAGTTTTLPAGSSAQVTVNNTGNTSVLNFGIPQGLKGDKGDAGTPGAQGPRGFAATVNVGQTTTGEPGTSASVVNAGNEHDAVLKFTIPQGAKGDTGDTGPQGPTGGVKSTVVAELPETGESDKYYLVNRTAEENTVTTTDGYAQITNDENAGDLTLNKLDGNTTQETLSGKNLLNINATPDLQSATVSINGETVTVTSTANAQTSRVVFTFPYIANTEMTFSFDAEVLQNDAADAANNVVFRTLGASDTLSVAAISNTVGVKQHFVNRFTPDNSTRSLWFYIKAQPIAGVRSVRFSNIQVEYGAASTDYEPYCGGVPSPNPNYPQEVKTVSGLQTVRITGKNLLDTSNAGNQSAGGMTATWNNGTVEVKGTNTATSFPLSNNIALPIQIKAGTEISASFSGASVGNTFFRFYNQATSQYESLSLMNPNTSGTYTLTRDADAVQLYKGGVPTNTYKEFSISNWQIELGNQASEFEPYQGQSQEINLGKNLLHLANYSAGGVSTTLNSDGTITVSGTTANNYANFMAYQTPLSAPSGTYTFSRTGDNTYRASLTIFNRDKTQNTSINISAGSNSSTVVIPFDIGYVAGAFTNLTVGSNLNFTTGLQLELGSQATSFSPYKTPLELAKIGTYQDYIWNDGGTWKIHKEVGKVIINGSESYRGLSADTNTTRVVCDALANAPAVSTFRLPLSNYFTAKTMWATDVEGIYTDTNDVVLRASNNIVGTTIASFKTWLSTHNTTVYYALATPTDTEITDSELIEQLNHIYELYQGTNNVWLIPSAGAQGEFTGDYVVYDKYNKHQVYIWSSDDNTWQIILP